MTQEVIGMYETNPSSGSTDAAQGKPRASTRDERIAFARRKADELYEDSMADTYRLANCDDGLTNHICRMLRCRQREVGDWAFVMSPVTLAAACDVTPATIRRRLDYLVRHGHLRRVFRGSRERGSSRWRWEGSLD
jgi:hypothetical protein